MPEGKELRRDGPQDLERKINTEVLELRIEQLEKDSEKIQENVEKIKDDVHSINVSIAELKTRSETFATSSHISDLKQYTSDQVSDLKRRIPEIKIWVLCGVLGLITTVCSMIGAGVVVVIVRWVLESPAK